MNKKLLEELLYCLSEKRTKYTYFKDKYCMFLLQNMITEKTNTQQLKQSQYAQFCHKPQIKEWLATYGSQSIDAEMLMALWQTELYHFTISLDQWGGDSPRWQQTCRKGYNLVLQLNFNKTHDRLYDQVKELKREPFIYRGHPVNSIRNTLAWSRIDISEDLTEVLIEEIQNDWLRKVQRAFKFLSYRESSVYFRRFGIKHDMNLFKKYYDNMIKPLIKIWDEAILCATLEFLINEVGVKHVYFYDFDTGTQLKSIDYGLPPRSLYTKLPKKFGFKTVKQAPRFIAEDKFSAKKLKRIKSPQWHYLQLEEKKYA